MQKKMKKEKKNRSIEWTLFLNEATLNFYQRKVVRKELILGKVILNDDQFDDDFMNSGNCSSILTHVKFLIPIVY